MTGIDIIDPSAGTGGEDFLYTPAVADFSAIACPLESQSFMSDDGPWSLPGYSGLIFCR